MESDQQWCSLGPKELIDFVSTPDATSIARKQRSSMYKGKLMQVRGLITEVDTFTLNSNYRIDLQDTLGHPWAWSVMAEVRPDQDEYVQSLRRGDEVTVSGTIDNVSSNYVGLENSYIDHNATKPYPKSLVEPLDRTNVPAWFLLALAQSLNQVDSGSKSITSHRLLDSLDDHISKLCEEVDYLAATKPRGEELRFMLTLLNRWCENPPTYPKADDSR